MTQVETRNIGYGLAASVALHVLLFASLALWMESSRHQKNLFPPPFESENTPSVSLVIAEDLILPPQAETEPATDPETSAPKITKPAERYIRTTQNEDLPQAPEKADFISDRNTIASSKMAPSSTGASELPTMEGVSFLTHELANRDYKDGEIKEDSATSNQLPSNPAPEPIVPVQPSPAPASPPQDEPQLAMRQPDPPSETQVVKKTESSLETMMQELDQKLSARQAADPDAINLRRDQAMSSEPPKSDPNMAVPLESESAPPVPRAVPIPSSPSTPPAPSPEAVANTPRPQQNAFQPHTRTASVKGTISNRGNMDSVNAAATPTGRYMRQVTSTIERKWHALRKTHQDFVEPGTLRIRFYVNKEGKTEDISILENKANAVLTDFSLTAILKADLPPIPKDLLPILEKERVEIEYDIVIY